MLLPDYSVYAGTPSHVANQRVRANAPSFIADNELKKDILMRQTFCLSQVGLNCRIRYYWNTFIQGVSSGCKPGLG